MATGYHEPGKLEVWLAVLAGKLFGRSVYQPYVNSLGLRGDERVLDFGSGAGTPALLLARRLLPGGGHVTCVDVSAAWLEAARKRLARWPNVAFKLGEISELGIADGSHDLVFIHFVIHDIPGSQRPHVAKHLARKLVTGGRLTVREPLNVIAQDEIRRLMRQNSLSEVRATTARVPLMGPTYEGIYVKEEREHAQDS